MGPFLIRELFFISICGIELISTLKPKIGYALVFTYTQSYRTR